MRIVGPPTADKGRVTSQIVALGIGHPRFTTEMFDPLWSAALRYCIDPVGLVAQAYKETGAGNFGGNVKPEHCNPCGLKIRYLGLYPEASGDLPLAHQMFPNWATGARAHAQHLRAYAGCPVEDTELVDPRYFLVFGKFQCIEFEDLGGKWAPSLTYGTELVALARKLRGGM